MDYPKPNLSHWVTEFHNRLHVPTKVPENQNHRKRVYKISFLKSQLGMLQCHKSVDRFPNIGRPIYLILSGIPAATYRSTDLPKSVDRFVLWTNQFKTKRIPKRRVQTIIKIILTKPGLPQQPLGLSSRARTCGTRFRRTDPEESSKDLKSQNTVFKELSSSKPQTKVQTP